MCKNWIEESTYAPDLGPVLHSKNGNNYTIRLAIDDCISLFQLLVIYNIYNNINNNIKNNINNNNNNNLLLKWKSESATDYWATTLTSKYHACHSDIS